MVIKREHLMRSKILLTDTRFLWSFTATIALLVYAVGMTVPIMEPDGGVYAEISREMYRNGNFFEIYLKGQDWLDKPHFQFWFTALTFKLLGYGTFAYKLPAVLFMLLGAYYTFRFGRKFYNARTGYLAALFLLTAQHIITSNSDVRAEPYLTGMTIFSLYYLAGYLRDKKAFQLIAGSLGLAILLMTKGLFTIIPVASGLGLALLYERKWKEILHWQWLALIALTFLFIAPTLWGYYQQFDLHPEKEIFGRHDVSGLKFFFWDSQWGRFTNTGPIKGEGDPSFFLHTMLWAYLPWTFLAYFALFIKAKALIKGSNDGETYTFFGFIFMFIVFSVSSFQLPHYLNALFPLLSVVTADLLMRYATNDRFLKVFYQIQLWSSVILIALAAAIHFVFSGTFPKIDVIIVFFAGIFIISRLLMLKGQRLRKIIFIPAIAILLVNYYINRDFYPQLLQYQSESEAAFYLNNHAPDAVNVVSLDDGEQTLSFYLDRVVPYLPLEEVSRESLAGKYVYTDEQGLKAMRRKNIPITEVATFPDFPVTTLNGTFLNKNTRKEVLTMKYLLKVPVKPAD